MLDGNGQVDVKQRVIKILSGCFQSGRTKVLMESRLVEDLRVDSIDLVEIVMALNDEFGIDLPESDVQSWSVVEDVYNLVRTKIAVR